MGGDETRNRELEEDSEREANGGFKEYIELLYKEGLQLDLEYKDMYYLDLEELENTIIERRKGLAYKIWRISSFLKHPFIENFPETPEDAMPELYPPKPSIPMPTFLMKKYYEREGVKVNEQ